MLYYLFDFLDKQFDLPGAGLFQYITFRSSSAIILSLVISLVLGKRIVSYLKRLQVGETVRDLGLTGQKEKEGTPTMGGFIIIAAIMIPCLLFGKIDNIYLIIMLVTTVWLGLIGFADDYIKVFKKNKAGLKSTTKIIGQVTLGLFIGSIMLLHEDIVVRMPLAEAQKGGYEITRTYQTVVPTVNTQAGVRDMAYVKTTLTNVPLLKDNSFDYQVISDLFVKNSQVWLWLIFIPIVIFIVTAISNAANLTDGLDGLAAGVSAIIGMALAIFAYVSGNTIIADYLNIFYLPNISELTIFASCFVGACIGFLWHNSYPARVFMGDTGSLTIGGIIAVMALLLRKELLLPILCGIFVVENLSVVLQVGYFKYTKRKYGEGRRIFKMAPLHHHYQKNGMHEAKIAVRFWIVTIILAIIGIITLKVR
ncbi:MAG: phospho-N-acetylmuramoyl-pentapeptide-transferase [Saprospiraceae bacterium]|nr:phospho-N-acetylmuramoyl-pentapeptide-transferase [Saprospiraceae bacterium]